MSTQGRVALNVTVHVIEARDLTGKNWNGLSDPFVRVTVANRRQQTEIRRNQLSATWDDVFRFQHIEMSVADFEHEHIHIQVFDANTFFRNELIGQFSFSLAKVRSKPPPHAHQIFKRWVALTCPSSPADEQGFLLLSVTVLGPGDSPPSHSANHQNILPSGSESGMPMKQTSNPDGVTSAGAGNNQISLTGERVLRAPAVRRRGYNFSVKLFSGEDLPATDMWGNCDPFIVIRFNGIIARTPTQRQTLTPQWNHMLTIPVYTPCFSELVEMQVWDYRRGMPDHLLGSVRLRFSDILGEALPPTWFNLYGDAVNQNNLAASWLSKSNSRRGDDEARAYLGRILASFSATLVDRPLLASHACAPVKGPKTDAYVLWIDLYQASDLPIPVGGSAKIEISFGPAGNRRATEWCSPEGAVSSMVRRGLSKGSNNSKRRLPLSTSVTSTSSSFWPTLLGTTANTIPVHTTRPEHKRQNNNDGWNESKSENFPEEEEEEEEEESEDESWSSGRNSSTVLWKSAEKYKDPTAINATAGNCRFTPIQILLPKLQNNETSAPCLAQHYDLMINVYVKGVLGGPSRVGFLRIKAHDIWGSTNKPEWHAIKGVNTKSSNGVSPGNLLFSANFSPVYESPVRAPMLKTKLRAYQIRAYVYQARNLPATSASGLENCFVQVSVAGAVAKLAFSAKSQNKGSKAMPSSTNKGGSWMSTSLARGTLDPVWYETLLIESVQLPKELTLAPDIRISVCEEGKLGYDTVAQCRFPAAVATTAKWSMKARPRWLPLASQDQSEARRAVKHDIGEESALAKRTKNKRNEESKLPNSGGSTNFGDILIKLQVVSIDEAAREPWLAHEWPRVRQCEVDIATIGLRRMEELKAQYGSVERPYVKVLVPSIPNNYAMASGYLLSVQAKHAMVSVANSRPNVDVRRTSLVGGVVGGAARRVSLGGALLAGNGRRNSGHGMILGGVDSLDGNSNPSGDSSSGGGVGSGMPEHDTIFGLPVNWKEISTDVVTEIRTFLQSNAHLAHPAYISHAATEQKQKKQTGGKGSDGLNDMSVCTWSSRDVYGANWSSKASTQRSMGHIGAPRNSRRRGDSSTSTARNRNNSTTDGVYADDVEAKYKHESDGNESDGMGVNMSSRYKTSFDEVSCDDESSVGAGSTCKGGGDRMSDTSGIQLRTSRTGLAKFTFFERPQLVVNVPVDPFYAQSMQICVRDMRRWTADPVLASSSIRIRDVASKALYSNKMTAAAKGRESTFRLPGFTETLGAAQDIARAIHEGEDGVSRADSGDDDYADENHAISGEKLNNGRAVNWRHDVNEREIVGGGKRNGYIEQGNESGNESVGEEEEEEIMKYEVEFAKSSLLQEYGIGATLPPEVSLDVDELNTILEDEITRPPIYHAYKKHRDGGDGTDVFSESESSGDDEENRGKLDLTLVGAQSLWPGDRYEASRLAQIKGLHLESLEESHELQPLPYQIFPLYRGVSAYGGQRIANAVFKAIIQARPLTHALTRSARADNKNDEQPQDDDDRSGDSTLIDFPHLDQHDLALISDELEQYDFLHQRPDCFPMTLPHLRHKRADLQYCGLNRPGKVSPLASTLTTPQHIKVRIYVVACMDLAAHDSLRATSNPYITVQMKVLPNLNSEEGTFTISERSNYKTNTLNPFFGSIFELDACFPDISELEIQIWNAGYVSDDLIGKTEIDLEDRWFNPLWQTMRHEGKRMQEFRPLWNAGAASQSKLPQGKVEMWVEMYNKHEALESAIVDIRPPEPTQWELRVVVWETRRVPLLDDYRSLDLYISAELSYETMQGDWMPQQHHDTDVHTGVRDGRGIFNWRMKFDVQAPCLLPRLKFVVWNRDYFSSNDALGEANIDLGALLQSAAYVSSDKIERPRIWVKLAHQNWQGEDRGEIELELSLVRRSHALRRPVGNSREKPNRDPFLPDPPRESMWAAIFRNLSLKRAFCTAVCVLLPILVIVSLFSGG